MAVAEFSSCQRPTRTRTARRNRPDFTLAKVRGYTEEVEPAARLKVILRTGRGVTRTPSHSDRRSPTDGDYTSTTRPSPPNAGLPRRRSCRGWSGYRPDRVSLKASGPLPHHNPEAGTPTHAGQRQEGGLPESDRRHPISEPDDRPCPRGRGRGCTPIPVQHEDTTWGGGLVRPRTPRAATRTPPPTTRTSSNRPGPARSQNRVSPAREGSQFQLAWWRTTHCARSGVMGRTTTIRQPLGAQQGAANLIFNGRWLHGSQNQPKAGAQPPVG